MSEPNPFLGKSQAERDRQRALLDQADAAESAALDVAMAAALKCSYEHLKSRGKLGAAFEAVTPQSMPKEMLLGRPANLSETQIDLIKKTTVEAIQKSAKI